MSSNCYAQNDVQQTLSSLISQMNQMKLKSAEDTTAIQILTESMARLQGMYNISQDYLEKIQSVGKFTYIHTI